MTHSSDAGAVAAFLYRHLSAHMPAPVLNGDGELDVEADNALIEAWSDESELVDLDLNIETVERFLDDVQLLCDRLLNTDPADYMIEFFDAARRTFDGDKSKIRIWFQWLYIIVLQTTSGPRWGDFVQVYGAENFDEKVRLRLFDISYMGNL